MRRLIPFAASFWLLKMIFSILCVCSYFHFCYSLSIRVDGITVECCACARPYTYYTDTYRNTYMEWIVADIDVCTVISTRWTYFRIEAIEFNSFSPSVDRLLVRSSFNFDSHRSVNVAIHVGLMQSSHDTETWQNVCFSSSLFSLLLHSKFYVEIIIIIIRWIWVLFSSLCIFMPHKSKYTSLT